MLNLSEKLVEKVELPGFGNYIQVSTHKGTFVLAKDICKIMKLDIHNTKTLNKYIDEDASSGKMVFFFNGEKVSGTFIDIVGVKQLANYSTLENIDEFVHQFKNRYFASDNIFQLNEAMPFFMGKLSALFPINGHRIVTSKEFKDLMDKIHESLAHDIYVDLFQLLNMICQNEKERHSLFTLLVKDKVVSINEGEMRATDHYVVLNILYNENRPHPEKDGFIRPRNVVFVTPFGMIYLIAKYVIDWRKRICNTKSHTPSKK